MATVGEYLQIWKLKLSTTKTVSAVFHLNNNDTKRELKVKLNNNRQILLYIVNQKQTVVRLKRKISRKNIWNLDQNNLHACVRLLSMPIRRF